MSLACGWLPHLWGKFIVTGIEKGVISFINEYGTVCSIGDYWFYFGGMTAEEMTPDEYIEAIPMEDIVNDVYSTLEDFRNNVDFRDEYNYYEAYLKICLGISG